MLPKATECLEKGHSSNAVVRRKIQEATEENKNTERNN